MFVETSSNLDVGHAESSRSSHTDIMSQKKQLAEFRCSFKDFSESSYGFKDSTAAKKPLSYHSGRIADSGVHLPSDVTVLSL